MLSMEGRTISIKSTDIIDWGTVAWWINKDSGSSLSLTDPKERRIDQAQAKRRWTGESQSIYSSIRLLLEVYYARLQLICDFQQGFMFEQIARS